MNIGQLFMVGFDGPELTGHIERMIAEFQVGGVILFRRNLRGPDQIRRLTAQLQALNAKYTDSPLLIAVDHESDMSLRFDEGVTALPSAILYRQLQRPDLARRMHAFAADELAALGINVNLAPVLDVNSNAANPVIGPRAFGETVEEVCRYGLAAMRGVHDAGLLACVKHFPGHGDTASDSHLDLPTVPHGQDHLRRVELAPFQAAIAQGAEMMMTAHVRFPAFEPDDLPATLSRRVLTDLLRGEMGYAGVVLTDCLEMAAVLERYGIAHSVPAAVVAGADLLLISHTESLQREGIQALREALARGAVPAGQVQQALGRVQSLKKKLGGAPARAASMLEHPDHLSLSHEVFAGAMVRQGPLKPLDAGQPVLALTFAVREYGHLDRIALGSVPLPQPRLTPALEQAGFSVREMQLAPSLTAAEFEQAMEAVRAHPQVLVLSFDACLHPTQAALLQAIDPARLWLLAGHLPYDLDLVRGAQAALSVCSHQPAALRPLLEALGVRPAPPGRYSHEGAQASARA